MTLLLKGGSSPLGAGSACGPRQDRTPEGVLTDSEDEAYSVIAECVAKVSLESYRVVRFAKKKKHRSPTRLPVLFLWVLGLS